MVLGKRGEAGRNSAVKAQQGLQGQPPEARELQYFTGGGAESLAPRDHSVNVELSPTEPQGASSPAPNSVHSAIKSKGISCRPTMC